MLFAVPNGVSRFVLAAALVSGAGAAARAQSSPGYFMPPSNSPAASAPRPAHHAVRPSAAAASPVAAPAAAASDAGDANASTSSQPLPAIPQLAALPKVAPPPAAVIGVLSVPEVMQKSTAAQGVQAIIRDRQAALGAEAQKARAEIQSDQAKIVAERGKLTDAALEAKERALQDQVSTTQTSFQERNQAIQNSGQAALSQIEAELIAVIRQEAQAHGMNLVLHREQVALNVDAFDITGDVANELNKLLPSVPVPPSVVTPGMHVDTPDEADSEGQQ